MTTRRLFPLALLMTLALGSCEKDDATLPTQPTALLQSRWQLTQIDKTPVATSSYAETSKSYLEFVALGTCTVGLGPCNNFSGRYALAAGSQELHITPQIATRATCPVQDLETRYLDNLALTARYEISGNELRLYDATTPAPRLLFRRTAQ
ncbi:META domain-containing protein [Hymenobacter siberiensis]|jgi:heat shock protein HslJ|uniref:META domain-containing protein n=1 Tax=Hymenobacter siberiensis TaxID=2848396 RepID=UPI001C1E6BBF|nr:META domain-containing protein [Hymenobacter siberiensis]